MQVPVPVWLQAWKGLVRGCLSCWLHLASQVQAQARRRLGRAALPLSSLCLPTWQRAAGPVAAALLQRSLQQLLRSRIQQRIAMAAALQGQRLDLETPTQATKAAMPARNCCSCASCFRVQACGSWQLP